MCVWIRVCMCAHMVYSLMDIPEMRGPQQSAGRVQLRWLSSSLVSHLRKLGEKFRPRGLADLELTISLLTSPAMSSGIHWRFFVVCFFVCVSCIYIYIFKLWNRYAIAVLGRMCWDVVFMMNWRG